MNLQYSLRLSFPCIFFFFLFAQWGLLLGSSTAVTPNFKGAFDGALVDGDVYYYPSTAESWAGYANLAYIYPLAFPNGGTITFTGAVPNGGDVGIRFRFESLPWPKPNPAYDSPTEIISGASPTNYSITIPSQGDNTFNSALLYLNTRDRDVILSDFTININPQTSTGPGGPGGPGGSTSNPVVEAPKKKILVLHGHGSTASGTRNWAPFQNLTDALGIGYEFFYAQATGTTPDWYGNMDENISNLSRFIDENGPFYGIIGYSQGTSMIMTLMNYKKNLNFERVVLFNGFAPGQIHWDYGSETMQTILYELNTKKPLNKSVFVYIGMNDSVVPPSTSNKLRSFFKNSRYYENSYAGHEPPTRYQGGFDEIVSFLTSDDVDEDGILDSLDAYPHDASKSEPEAVELSLDNSEVGISWDDTINRNWKLYKRFGLLDESDHLVELKNYLLHQNRFSFSDSTDQGSCFYYLKSE